MKIKRVAICGSLESSDCAIRIEPGDERVIEIESSVFDEFSHLIKAQIIKVLDEFEIKGCKLSINDKGALDYVIAARVESAIRRAI